MFYHLSWGHLLPNLPEPMTQWWGRINNHSVLKPWQIIITYRLSSSAAQINQTVRGWELFHQVHLYSKYEPITDKVFINSAVLLISVNKPCSNLAQFQHSSANAFHYYLIKTDGTKLMRWNETRVPHECRFNPVILTQIHVILLPGLNPCAIPIKHMLRIKNKDTSHYQQTIRLNCVHSTRKN